MGDWLDRLGDTAKMKLKQALGGIQGEFSWGDGDGGTSGSITVGQRPGLSWPLAFGILLLLVLVLAWRD